MRQSFLFLALAIYLASCGKSDPINLAGVDPALTVSPTQVMVLGTAHLSNYRDELTLDDLEPLLDRLKKYAPDIITIENSPGMVCNRVRAYPLEHVGYADGYCFDGAPFQEESGLSVAEGSYKARKTLKDWPDAPSAAQRRALAAAFIASNEPQSGLVQWLRLDELDRVADDGLGPKSVELLNKLSQSMNESSSIAARLAANLGRERLFYVDDHGSYIETGAEREAYGARLTELWQGGGSPCREHHKIYEDKLTQGDILGAYKYLNSRNSHRKQMACDWKLAMNDAAPEAYGRKYSLGWQARNLRMTALIMTAATTEPGGRVLSIVGASHKPYFDAYLNQMHDVEIVSTDTVLD